MHGVSTIEVLKHGWFILSVLAAMSILSITVIIDRWFTLRRAYLETKPFVLMVLKLMERDVGAALEHCRKFDKPLAHVIDAILLTPGAREAKERAYRHVLRAEISEMQTRVPVLGTIGSTAPFIGLFGTVVGIIRAFHDIAQNVGGGPEIVAAGISEALVATAAGLVVAIPAIIFYNFFLTRIRRFAEEMDLVAFEVIERVNLESGE
jgi:biopolymer transport protein ExbB/TolQ